jgi:outer membrane protein TolC
MPAAVAGGSAGQQAGVAAAPARVASLASAPLEPQADLTALVPGRYTLDLSALVQLSLVYNATVRASRQQSEATAQLLEGERALYEPSMVVSLRRESAERPRTFEERTEGLTNIGKETAVENYATGSIGLRGKAPSGASYELSNEVRRRQSNLLQDLATRENRGTLSLVIKQPLLRGAGRAMTEADLRIAELERQIEQQRTTKQLLDTAAEAAGTYWQLYRAGQLQALRELSLGSSRDLLADTQRRVAGGMAPRVDVIDADLAVRARQTELARADLQSREMTTRVRSLLSLSAEEHGGVSFVAAEPPLARATSAESRARAGSASQSAATAPLWAQMRASWPAYQIAALRFEQETVRLGFARDQTLPDLNLELGYNANSLNESTRASARRIWDGVNPGWYVQLTLDVALGNQRAQSRQQAQALKLQAARSQLEAETQLLGNEWLVRADQLDALWQEARALQADVGDLYTLVQAERLSFEHGRARARDVIVVQDRLDDARLRALDAQVKAELAEVALQAVDGRLLAAFDVTLEAP